MTNRLHLVSDPARKPASELLTFLIADVRGYTRFTQQQGDEEAAKLAARFAVVTREEVERYDGQVVELRGDEALAVFRSPRQALRAAADLQERCVRERHTNPNLPLEIGIGLDAGEAVQVEGGYRGGALNLASRLCSAAGPDRIFASQTVIHLARKLKGLTYAARGAMRLKGFDEPVHVVEVIRDEDIDSAAPVRQALPDTADMESVDVPRQQLPTGGFLGSLPESQVVDRWREMDILTRLLDGLSAGGRLVILSGEPGVGKTRLAQEISAEAHRRGYVIAAGICYEQQQVVPYHPFREVLAMVFSLCPATLRGEAPARWPQLGRLLPDLGAVPAHSENAPEEQARLFWTVGDFLQTVSQINPIVLALDDLQWADDSSLQLLSYLARQTRAHHVFLLGTYRSEEIDRDHLLAHKLLELHRQHLVEQIVVKPLERDEARSLVEVQLGSSAVPDDLTELIYERTEGNPFFIQELVATLLERGNLYQEGRKWVGRGLADVAVPDQVRALIEQRLARLDRATQETLADAAILGQVFSFQDVQSLSGRDEDELEAALQEAVGAGLIREVGKDSYAFTHTLVHQAVEDTLPARRRRRLHAAAGEMIERTRQATGGVEARAAELAWHFVQAEEPDRALPYAVLAGDQAAQAFAQGEAERLYRMALDIVWETNTLEDAVPRSRRALAAHALDRLGGVLQTVGRYGEALEMLERAARAYEEMRDVEGQRRVVAQIGSIHAYQGTTEEGLARLQPLLDATKVKGAEEGTEGLALLLSARAHLLVASGRFKDGLKEAEQAEQVARRLANQHILVEIEIRRAEALSFLGRHEDARAVLENAVPLLQPSDQATFFRALNGLATTRTLSGDLEQAKPYHERALDIAEHIGDRRGIVLTLFWLSRVTFWQGDWDGSYGLLARALETAKAHDMPSLRSFVRIAQAHLLTVHGEVEKAGEILREERAAAQRDGDVRRIAFAAECLAEHELLQGAAESARKLLEPLLPSVETSSVDLLELLPVLARARLATSDVEGAETLIDQGARHVAATRSRIGFADVVWTRGMVRAAQGRRAEARHLFEASLSLVRSMNIPWQEGRILLEWGKMEAADGAVAEARDRLETALDLFERSGAQAFTSSTKAALHALDRSR